MIRTLVLVELEAKEEAEGLTAWELAGAVQATFSRAQDLLDDVTKHESEFPLRVRSLTVASVTVVP